MAVNIRALFDLFKIGFPILSIQFGPTYSLLEPECQCNGISGVTISFGFDYPHYFNKKSLKLWFTRPMPSEFTVTRGDRF